MRSGRRPVKARGKATGGERGAEHSALNRSPAFETPPKPGQVSRNTAKGGLHKRTAHGEGQHAPLEAEPPKDASVRQVCSHEEFFAFSI